MGMEYIRQCRNRHMQADKQASIRCMQMHVQVHTLHTGGSSSQCRQERAWGLAAPNTKMIAPVP